MRNIWNFDHVLAYTDATGGIDEAWNMNVYYNGEWKQDLTVPTLPPPKRILKPYSRIHTAPHIFYEIVGQDKRAFRSEVRVNKYHNLIKDEGKLRLLRTGYYFLRDKNAMSEIKGAFHSLVYNTKTKTLYIIKPENYHKRKKNGDMYKKLCWGKNLTRIGINNVVLESQLHVFKSEHLEWFIKDMKQYIQKEIPNISDDCTEPWNRLIALNIQHRVGKAIPNINDNFLDNLASITRPQTLEMLIDEGPIFQTIESRMKTLNKLKRNHTYKFMPVLTETHSVKKAIKAVLGEYYHNIHSKTIFDMKWEHYTYQPFNLWKFGAYTPKSIQHYISKIYKNLKSEDDWEYFTKLIKETFHIISAYRQHSINEASVNSWIKAVKRLNTIIDWGIWKDVYYMADQLGIRIRPNQFTSIDAIMDMHDALGVLRRRNMLLLDDVEINVNTKFIEVVYPKKYMGYEFKQLLTPGELKEEHDKMGHCIHSYDRQCVSGQSVIFSTKGPNGQYWTIELNGNAFNFIQAEGAYSDNCGNRFICPREIINEVFNPFANTVYKNNQDRLGYIQHCTFIETIEKLKNQAFALDDLLGNTCVDKDLTKSLENKLTSLENKLIETNNLLENMIGIMPTINTADMDISKIQKLLTSASILLSRELIKKKKRRTQNLFTIAEEAAPIPPAQIRPTINEQVGINDVLLIPDQATDFVQSTHFIQ